MSPRKTLIVCSAWLWVALAACRVEAPEVASPPGIDFFSQENTPGSWVKPDVIHLTLNKPVFHFSSDVTGGSSSIDKVLVDDAALLKKLSYYEATTIASIYDGTWNVYFKKYCHFVRGVARDFETLDVVDAARTYSSGFGLENVLPFENGHNVMAPRVWVSLEGGSQDVCDAKIFLRITGLNGGELMSPTYENPVTDPATQHTGCYFYGISETPGTYDLEIAADGYASTHVTNVEIVLDDKLCHVVQKEIRVTLKKQ